MIESILALLGGLGIGGWLGWWLTERFGLEIAHRHRIIEEHTKAIHEYAEHYYLPYISLSRAVEESLRPAQNTKTEEELKESFFRLAQWFHMLYKWWKDIGAVFLVRDPTAEKLLRYLESKFLKFFGADIGIVERHTLMNVLESKPQVRAFFNKFKEKLGEDPLETVFKKYKQWLDNKAEVSSLTKELQCFHTLFLFEINMCYKSWYGKEPTKPDVDFDLLRKRLNELGNDGKITFEDAKKYLRRLGGSEVEIQKLSILIWKEKLAI